jgi:hypothetical protein
MYSPARIRLAGAVAVALSIAVGGCDFSTAPTGIESAGKAAGSEPQVEHDFRLRDRCHRTFDLLGKFDRFNPTWVVSHSSEQKCTDGASLVAGTRFTSKGEVLKLGESEIKVSAAWDWAVQAKGRFHPRGPATRHSATVLTELYHFSVNPFETIEPMSPVCGDTVKAKAEVTLVPENGDKILGVIVGGEVYELGFEKPGDGQEHFIVVEITDGTGRYETVRGKYIIHAIFDLEEGTMLEGMIRGSVSVPCRRRERDVGDPVLPSASDPGLWTNPGSGF